MPQLNSTLHADAIEEGTAAAAPVNCWALTVKCAAFGSFWWERPGATIADRAFMNTTGFTPKKNTPKKKVRCWCKPKCQYGGIVRINSNRPDLITRYEDLIGDVCRSPGVVRSGSENRLFLHPQVRRRSRIDCYLVRLASAQHGFVNLESGPFAGQIQLVSASKRQGQQEVLILMWPSSSVTTTLGKLELSWILKHQ